MLRQGYWGTWRDYRIFRSVYRDEEYCRRELSRYGFNMTDPEFLRLRKEAMKDKQQALLRGEQVRVIFGTGADPAPEVPALLSL